jgi:hypothetical protein
VLPFEDADDFLDGQALDFRQEPVDKGDRGQGKGGEADHDAVAAVPQQPPGQFWHLGAQRQPDVRKTHCP